jgi:hypothetical protein
MEARMSAPWMKFYPRDWRGDQALRSVSIAARGLWMECLCIMHEARPYGHLMLNGQPVEDGALARMTGASVDEVSALMAELRKAGAFSVTREGVIFSRRMTKDHARANKGRKAVQKRWTQHTENTSKSDGPIRSPIRGPTTQKPEARDQNHSYPASQHSYGGAAAIDHRIPDLLAALGITDETKTPGLLSLSDPIRWVEGGCDIDTDIIPTLREFAAKGKVPRSWAYCSDAVFEARDRRLRPAPALRDRPQSTSPPRVPRNAGEAARLELQRRGEYHASDDDTGHHDQSDRDPDPAGARLIGGIAVAAGR